MRFARSSRHGPTYDNPPPVAVKQQAFELEPRVPGARYRGVAVWLLVA
jgi:hypothetical protein